jgi:hypothetical protein
MTRAGHVPCWGQKRNAYMTLVRKCEGKRPLERPRRRRENIKIYLKENEWEGVEMINLAKDRDMWRTFVVTIMNLGVS